MTATTAHFTATATVVTHAGVTVTVPGPCARGNELDCAEQVAAEIFGEQAHCDDEHAEDRTAIAEAIEAARR